MQNSIEVAQLEMQQKLGRCMLLFQQYERMLKVVVATATVEGAPENLTAILLNQKVDASTMTLGTLVRHFRRDCLVDSEQVASSTEWSVDDEHALVVPSFKVQFAMSMSSEQSEQVSMALIELKEMRNALVHHLIERFEISDKAGCLAASRYLDECCQTIDGHLGQLKEWTDERIKAQKLLLSLWQSKEFENAFVHGISPDGTVNWPQSTIVECLRDAEKSCGVDGWTSLNTAITFIMREHRDQTPMLYGCETWRKVLVKSGQFELRSEVGSEAIKGKMWYRSRESS